MSTISRSTRSARSRLTALGAVLVGGRGSRFGSDKALAEFAGQSLLARSLQTLRNAGIDRLIYVGGEPRGNVQDLATHVHDDANLPQCALRGVVAAMEFTSELAEAERPDCVVIVACDLPLLQPATVKRLIHQVGDNDAAVVSAARDHWSCVAVRPAVTSRLKVALTTANSVNSDLAMATAFSQLRVARVVADEGELTNVNHPEVLARIITDDVQVHR